MFIRSDRHLGESPKLPDSVIWLLRMGYEMQRDDDYVRELLLAIEASDKWIVFLGYLDESDREQQKRYYHALMLADAGLLEVRGANLDHFRIRSQGHDFIAAIRDDDAWGKVKKAAQAGGHYGIKTLVAVADAYVRAKIGEATGYTI